MVRTPESAHASTRYGLTVPAGGSRAWLLLPAAALVFQSTILIVRGVDVGSWGWDHSQYHTQAIQKFAEQLPTPDLVNYASATSPGWHLLLALLLKAGAGFTLLRGVSTLAGVVLLLSATHTAARWVSPRTAACLLLPLAFSPFAVGGSAWITTDVPALACVALSLGAAMGGMAIVSGSLTTNSTSAPRPRWMWMAAVWASLGVCVRQPVAWLAAPIAWRALKQKRWSALLPALLPVAILGLFVALWGGLMPPPYRYLHSKGANPAALPLMLALAGCWGLPLLLALLASARGDSAAGANFPWSRLARNATVGAVASLVVAALIPTSMSVDEGRCFGPLWQLIERVPAPANRSLVMLVLAPLGGASIAGLATLAFHRGAGALATMVLLGLLMATAANMANSQAWQRYADLPLLLLLPWLAALASRGARAGAWVSAAAALVALMQLGMATVNLWKPALGGNL